MEYIEEIVTKPDLTPQELDVVLDLSGLSIFDERLVQSEFNDVIN